MNYLKLLLLVFYGSLCKSYGQTTIYSQDFTEQLNKGAYYNTTTGLTETDLSGVNWTIDLSGATFNSNLDKFKVVNAARFLEARDLNGPGIWYSPALNISAFSAIQFSIDVTESSPILASSAIGNLEDADTVITEFRIDGGAWIQAGNNGFIKNDYLDTTVSHNAVLNGNTLELRVIITNNADDELMRIDNIIVEGIAPTASTISINPSSAIINTLSTVENNVPLLAETFTVEGAALTNDIVISAPTDFVIATALNGPYTNSITLTQTSGTVNLTTIYTQLAFGLTVNNYNGSISVISTGATTANVAASGTILAHNNSGNCTELFISEYHEAATGTPNEQYIELYNPTNTSIDLSHYQITRFLNGRVNETPVIRTLTGAIAPYATYLIAKNNANLCNTGSADYCNGSAVMNFDGNDVIALQNSNGINIDVVGVLNVNNQFGQNVGLVRNLDIQAPTTAYNPANWLSIPANNTVMLGWHTNNCLCTTTTIWELAGGWDNGTPTATTAAIINAPYNVLTNGNITACSLTVRDGIVLTVADISYLDIETNIVVEGSGVINVQKNGAVVQNNPNAKTVILDPTNGEISVTKETAFIKAWYEYTYWSSPVIGETIGTTFSGTNPDRRFNFNAGNFVDVVAESMNNNGTTPGQDDVDDDNNDWQIVAATEVMQPGVGYACTLSPTAFNAANSLPGGPFPDGVKISHVFEGCFNNGTVNVPIERNDTFLVDNNWNFIGNPYPSAISIDAFFTLNAYSATNTFGTIDGAIYLWSQDTAPSDASNGNSTLNFDTSDYAIINITGATGALEVAGGDTITPSRFIASGQGFFVNYNNSGASTGATGNVSSGEIIFNNTMRSVANNNQFFKNKQNKQPQQDNKIWLELTTDNGIYGQILIGYVPNATDGDDNMSYDAVKNQSTGYSSFLYSTISGSNKKFGIQGKAPSSLNMDEEISLGLYTTITEPTLYKISMLQFEGDFFSNNTVYLEDSLMNTVYNLSNSDYTFTSAVGEFNERFKIVFNSNTLSTNNFEAGNNNLSIIELQNNDVMFNYTGDSNIKSIKILDMLGRVVYNFRESENTKIYNLAKVSSLVYIAKIELFNGNFITKKAIKK